MGDTIVEQILHSYGLRHSAVLSTQKGYRNESHPVVLSSGQKANLILYKNEPGIITKIQNANRVSNYLATQGFPTRKTFDARTIQLKGRLHTRYGALYEYLPGDTIPWEAYTQDHIKLLGKTMSDMHAALEKMPNPPRDLVADEYLAIIKRMQAYFGDELVEEAIMQKLSVRVQVRVLPLLASVVAASRTMVGQQALHMDFVRGNILFEGKHISGIIDFEKTSYGLPEFDIARTLAFLLVDCKYKDNDKVRKYFLHSGYQKRGQAYFTRPELLEKLVTLFLIYDFYKFLRHNPYESLMQNEHYIRTKDILLRKHILRMIK